MSLQADGRRSLKADMVHLESVHPQVVIPVTADLTVIIDDTIPVQTTTVPYQLSVPKGDVAGVGSVKVVGKNSDIDSGSSPEDVWEGSGIWIEPTVAQIHDIVSDDANDAVAGTGALSIRVSGLDGSGLEISEVIATNGLTIVTTVNSYNPIHELKVISAGALGINAGNITATAQTDATLQIVILPGDNKSLSAIYKIPSNKTAYMSNLHTSMRRNSSTGAGEAFLLAKETGEVWAKEDLGPLQMAGNSSNVQEFDPYIQYPSDTLLKVQASVTSNNTEVFASFQLYLVDN